MVSRFCFLQDLHYVEFLLSSSVFLLGFHPILKGFFFGSICSLGLFHSNVVFVPLGFILRCFNGFLVFPEGFFI